MAEISIEELMTELSAMTIPSTSASALADLPIDQLMKELELLTVPSKPIMSECSKRLLEDVKVEIRNNPSNYSRERFLNEIQLNHYDDKPKIILIHELEEYGLYPLIRNVLLGKYSIKV